MILSLLFRLVLRGLDGRSMLYRSLSRLDCIANNAHSACFPCYECGIVCVDTRQAIGFFERSQAEEMRCRGLYSFEGGDDHGDPRYDDPTHPHNASHNPFVFSGWCSRRSRVL